MSAIDILSEKFGGEGFNGELKDLMDKMPEGTIVIETEDVKPEQIKVLNEAEVPCIYFSPTQTERQVVKALEMAKLGFFKVIFACPFWYNHNLMNEFLKGSDTTILE